MKSILVPLDLSDATTSLLEHAGNFAKALQAKVYLLHVIEPVASYVPVGASMDVLAAPAPSQSPDPADVEKRLRHLAETLVNKATQVDIKAVIGLAVEEVLASAESDSVDYIVMASHGHGALYHLFSGSVVTGVLKRAKCPVLVVPASSSAVVEKP